LSAKAQGFRGRGPKATPRAGGTGVRARALFVGFVRRIGNLLGRDPLDPAVAPHSDGIAGELVVPQGLPNGEPKRARFWANQRLARRDQARSRNLASSRSSQKSLPCLGVNDLGGCARVPGCNQQRLVHAGVVIDLPTVYHVKITRNQVPQACGEPAANDLFRHAVTAAPNSPGNPGDSEIRTQQP